MMHEARCMKHAPRRRRLLLVADNNGLARRDACQLPLACDLAWARGSGRGRACGRACVRAAVRRGIKALGTWSYAPARSPVASHTACWRRRDQGCGGAGTLALQQWSEEGSDGGDLTCRAQGKDAANGRSRCQAHTRHSMAWANWAMCRIASCGLPGRAWPDLAWHGRHGPQARRTDGGAGSSQRDAMLLMDE